MTIGDLKEQCRKQIALIPKDAHVTLILPGSLGYGAKPRRKRLWQPDGPFGNPFADAPKGGVLVRFDAREVLNALEAQVVEDREGA